MGYGVGHRRSLDPELLWLWCRPVATAPIQPLAWEPPYAVGAAQRNGKKTKEKKIKRKRINLTFAQEPSKQDSGVIY